MSVTWFISDVHLSPENPGITDCFVRFLQREAAQSDALYILGDLFEAWIGNDVDDDFTRTVKAALKNWSKPLYLMQGNRDFLMNDAFAKSINATFLPDPTVIALYGVPVLISHGDLLCQEDKGYLRYRRIVHQQWLQKFFLWLPLGVRQTVAQKMRQESSKYVSQASPAYMDVTPSAVREWLSIYKVSQIIHGHTHRPQVEADRVVLPAWHEKGGGLRVSPMKSAELVYFD